MDVVQKRFDELELLAKRITDSQTTKYVDGEVVPTLDGRLMVEWQTSVLSLLSRVFGVESPTFRQFDKQIAEGYYNIQSQFTALYAVFASALSDYKGGYLFQLRNVLNAAVFDDELEQAKHFLDANYKSAAAVIAGTVLETTLRTLCDHHPDLTPSDNINKMNDDLAKKGVYNALRKRQVSSWADIRNSAAHGRPEAFEPTDVARMIDGVRDFIAIQLR
jgi:hypothetical protein